MPTNPADSSIYRLLFGDAETAVHFSDTAEIRTMLLVEGALARVQGALGLIPPEAATVIDRLSREVKIDPAALASETATNGVPVPGLLAAFRKAAGAPDAMQYLHWGATSQDIMDTGLALRLRPVLALWVLRLETLLGGLGRLAQEHAELPMAARTYGQFATPTSFGAVVAGWGWPLLAWRTKLEALRPAVLKVSLSGAAGTLSAMSGRGPEVRAALAKALDLADPGHGWHSDRSGISELAGFLGGLAGSLGKIGDDLLILSQSGLEEVRFAGSGGSSTMPQKENPVGASALVALARQVIGLSAVLQGSALHRQNRDGAAWYTEWLVLPQLCVSMGRMLALACELVQSLRPDSIRMARLLGHGSGLIHAEALSFVLAEHMPRPEAHTVVKALCLEAQAAGVPLLSLAETRFSQSDLADRVRASGLGVAPAEALAFAKEALRGKA